VSADQGRQRRGNPEAGPADPATSLDQAFDADSLYALRSAVAAHASAAGFDRHRVYDVTAVAHELAANAVVHGAGHGRLLLWAADGFLYCQVSDDGELRAADGRDAAAEEAAWPVEHGHGLWLVGEIAERVGIGRGPEGTTATVRFPLASLPQDHRRVDSGGQVPGHAGDRLIRQPT
jgi:anti-sigma regulatory factor (Ser/Thr protein kinase)